MTLEDAKNQIKKIIENNCKSLEEIDQLFTDLLNDNEIEPANLQFLLSRLTNYLSLPIGSVVIRAHGVYGTDKIALQSEVIRKYLRLIKKMPRPKFILTLGDEARIQNDSYARSFTQLIAQHQDPALIQEYIEFLIDLSTKQDSDIDIQFILRLFNFRGNNSKDRSFFKEITFCNIQIDIDWAPLNTKIKEFLSTRITFLNAIENLPLLFEQINTHLHYLNDLFSQFPSQYHTEILKPLTFALHWANIIAMTRVYSDDEKTFTIDTDTPSYHFHILAALLSKTAHTDILNTSPNLTIIGDIPLLPPPVKQSMALLLQHMHSIKFICSNIPASLQLLDSLLVEHAINDPNIFSITFNGVQFNSLVIDPQNNTPTLFKRVVALTISDYLITANDVSNEALFKFLNSFKALRNLTISNIKMIDPSNSSLSLSTIDQAVRKSGLTKLTLNIPLSDAELIHLGKVLTYNNTLRELQLPRGRFSSEALRRFAALLQNSNVTLHYVDLPPNTNNPPELLNILRSNIYRRNFYSWIEHAKQAIQNAKNFLESNNVAYRDQNTYELFDKLLKSCESFVTMTKEEKFASTENITPICEELVVYLSKMIFNLLNPDTYRMVSDYRLNVLKSLTTFITTPTTKAIYAENIYAFCLKSYDRLMDIIHNKSTTQYIGDKLVFKLIDSDLYKHINNDIELAITILLSIPLDHAKYYEIVNSLLFTLLKYKIKCLLELTIIHEAIDVIKNIETNAKNLKDLAIYLNNFIDDYPLSGKIVAQFSSIFADQKTSNADPLNQLRTAREQLIHIYRERFITPTIAIKDDQQSMENKQRNKKINENDATTHVLTLPLKPSEQVDTIDFSQSNTASLSQPLSTNKDSSNDNNHVSADVAYKDNNVSPAIVPPKISPINAEILDLMLKMPQLKSPVFSPVDFEQPQSSETANANVSPLIPPYDQQKEDELVLPSVPTELSTRNNAEQANQHNKDNEANSIKSPALSRRTYA